MKKYRNKTSIDLQQVMQHPGGPYRLYFTLCVQKSWQKRCRNYYYYYKSSWLLVINPTYVYATGI